MKNIRDNAYALEDAHKLIIKQPLGPKLAAYANKLHENFEASLETVCTCRGDYYNQPEYDYAPGEEERLEAWNEASDIITHYLQAMCKQLSISGLATCDIIEHLHANERWTELMLSALSDARNDMAALNKHMNARIKSSALSLDRARQLINQRQSSEIV